jgi:TIR domain-containing protein
VPLYSAYQYLVEKIREATDSVSRDENLNAQTVAALLLDARQRVQWDVFISYSSSDEEIAIRLRELLRKSNIRTFLAGIDLTQEIGSQKWFDALNLVLERSKVMILLASARALESNWVNHEIAEFVKRPRLLVPIPLGEHKLPAMLTDYQIVSWDGDLEASATIRRLLELVLGGLRATASST